MKRCFSCNKELEVEKPGRGEECPSCGADVKVCLNCLFYDPDSYNECREPQAERVVTKDRANFCDCFALRGAERKDGGGGGGGGEEDPLKGLKTLFKDP
ncbi:MAG: hypothetical protein V3W31_04800 [Thermodesulfobacteriota bacterium]